MNAAGPTQVQNAQSDPNPVDNEAQLSRQRVLKWALLGLLVVAGLITLVWWLVVTFYLAFLL